ncbi:MAG: hypothetical protein Q9214_000254, partial [Letrouitia sp. 1 TL-2023]
QSTIRNPTVQQEVIETLGTSSLTVHCGLIDLNLQLGTSYSIVNDSVVAAIPEAIHDFQRTFPDRYGFRVRLISEVLRYEANDTDNALVIAAAQKFLILSLVIAHNLVVILSLETSETVREYLFHEIYLTLSILLEDSLKQVLGLLQYLISRQRRADWPVISLALCLLLFGVESMQVDIYLRSRRAIFECKSMEETAILMLTEIFMASTGGFKPLTLDWDVEENASLVEGNTNAIKTLRGLQCLSQEYRELISSTRHYKYSNPKVQIPFCALGKPSISITMTRIA